MECSTTEGIHRALRPKFRRKLHRRPLPRQKSLAGQMASWFLCSSTFGESASFWKASEQGNNFLATRRFSGSKQSMLLHGCCDFGSLVDFTGA
jgi:hypothetical protein